MSGQAQVVGDVSFFAGEAGRAAEFSCGGGRDFVEAGGLVVEGKHGNNTVGFFVEEGDKKGKLGRDSGMEGGVEVGAAEAESRQVTVVRQEPERQEPAGDIDVMGLSKISSGGKFESLHGGIHKAACGATFHGGFAEEGPAFKGFANGKRGRAGFPFEQGGKSPAPDVAVNVLLKGNP